MKNHKHEGINVILLIYSVFIIMLLGLVCYNYTRLDNLEQQLENLPKEVCHIEEIILERYTVNNKEYQHKFPCGANIICEEGVKWDNLCAFDYQTIWSRISEEGKTCLITIEQEVCKLRPPKI